MGDKRFSSTTFTSIHASATRGGTTSATRNAEETYKKEKRMDPLVDPKGLPHLGPIRLSLPRFTKKEIGGKSLWRLSIGMPMPEETLLDTTASMGNNVDLAFNALPRSYELLAGGTNPILEGYDVQIATAIFNDVEDNDRDGTPVLCRSQYEMAEKIALQMTMLIPGRGGCGNYKEDPQFGLFGAAYLTSARINEYGLKRYHFTISDEPIVEQIDYQWLKQIFGDNVLEYVKQNGYDFTPQRIPDTAQAVEDLQEKSHAFYLHVPGWSRDNRVLDQWTDLYSPEYVVTLPEGTTHVHLMKAVIIGLTEGVLDLQSAKDFLLTHQASPSVANNIIRAVAHIPLGAQRLAKNYGKLPKAGDLFLEKTDLWPVDPATLEAKDGSGTSKTSAETEWL